MSNSKLVGNKIMQELQKMYEKICSKANINKLLIKAFYGCYLKLKLIPNMSTSLAYELANLNCILFFETILVLIRIAINKIMNKNRVRREPYNENVLVRKAIYYNEKHYFV